MQVQKIIKALALTTLIFIMAITATGCSCGGDKKSPTTPEIPEEPTDAIIDTRLLLGVNEAWVDTFPAGRRDGFVFNRDSSGAFIAFNDYADSVTFVTSENGVGRVSTTKDTLMTVMEGWLYFSLEDLMSAPYTISSTGDTLRLSITLNKPGTPELVEGVFTKTPGVTPQPAPSNVTPAKRQSRPAWK